LRLQRKKEGKSYQRRYLEGWIEFYDKELAKFVAATFNGQQVGGKKGNKLYDDIWNLKYLRNIKWHDLIESRVEQQQIRKKKLQQKIMSAKKEHDEYLGKSEKSKSLKGFLERKAKKLLEEEGEDPNDADMIKKVISSRLIRKKQEES
jgi:ESF2/ABP1 family protein